MAAASCETLHVAINSAAAYDQPRVLLLASLREARVPMHQVHVFLGGTGGSAAEGVWRQEEDGARFYRIPHNSVDFTGMVHIVENPSLFPEVRQWFYMHDTCAVGPGFWKNISRWCDRLPSCALPLTRYLPSSSMGLYDAGFLAAHKAEVLVLKNARGVPAEKWKKRGFGWEDRLIKVCDATSPQPIRRFTRRCWNATLSRRTCMCSQPLVEPRPQRVYGPQSSPRQVWRFPCADLVKYKANFQRNLTLVMHP